MPDQSSQSVPYFHIPVVLLVVSGVRTFAGAMPETDTNRVSLSG
ncbi:hypothetical protein [Streptomyces malaysiensis]|uniref:Uncharacterized protein n=1 Tax=Streptomyces malaysiensis subsp. samsunensis TaxID=459658 RepID=A0A9X2S1K1_STRMQ|nr:hypothetical protein [Streptomyces samsunensis]MCQ8836294.1 hypothetical protein [Streptomyces samsunensis]